MANKYTLGILSSFPQTKFEFSTKEVQLNEIKCMPINSISKESIELTTYTITNPINITPTVESTGENSFNLEETTYGYIQQTWNMSDSVIKYYTLPSKMELSAGSDYNPIIIPIKPETISTFIIDNDSFGINFGVVPFDEIIIDIPVIQPEMRKETLLVTPFIYGRTTDTINFCSSFSNNNFGSYMWKDMYENDNIGNGIFVQFPGPDSHSIITTKTWIISGYSSSEYIYPEKDYEITEWRSPGLSDTFKILFLDDNLKNFLAEKNETLNTNKNKIQNNWYIFWDPFITDSNATSLIIFGAKTHNTEYCYGKYELLNTSNKVDVHAVNNLLLNLNDSKNYIYDDSNSERLYMLVNPEKITILPKGLSGWYAKGDTAWDTDWDYYNIIYQPKVMTNIPINIAFSTFTIESFNEWQNDWWEKHPDTNITEIQLPEDTKRTLNTPWYAFSPWDLNPERQTAAYYLSLVYLPEEKLNYSNAKYVNFISGKHIKWCFTLFKTIGWDDIFNNTDPDLRYCLSTRRMGPSGINSDIETNGVIYPSFIKVDDQYPDDVPFGRYCYYNCVTEQLDYDIYIDVIPTEQ